MTMLFFMFVAMLICGLLYVYVARRLYQDMPKEMAWARTWLWGYLVFCWLVSLLPVFLHRQEVTGYWVDMLTWFVYVNMGFFSLLLVWYLAFDAVRLVRFGVQRVFAQQRTLEPSMGRRTFMTKVMSMGVVGTGSLTGIGVHQALGEVIVREIRVPIGVVEPLQGLRIVQFTDLHVGAMIKHDYVARIVKQMNQLKPDIIVMTGDLVDGSVSRLQYDVAPLADLDARYGKYFVTGNHEYYSGAEAWITEMERLGFVVLLNEHQVIEHHGATLLLAGVTDYRAHQYIPEHASSPLQAMQGAPETDVKILLAHQPKSIYEASRAGFDLQISGHTHGGQYYPWNFVARMANPYVQGLHQHEDKTWIYVSPGTGYWGPPIRLGSASEITVISIF